MVKVKYAVNSPARPRRGKGQPVVFQWNGRTYVRSAPRFNSGHNAYWRWWMRQEFALAARWAKSPEPMQYATAVEMAKNTEFIPRDILMMCSMGTYYTVRLPTGQVMEQGRMATSNVQYILDLLDPDPGAVIVRRADSWWAIPPGSAGQVLTIIGKEPGWAHRGGGGGGSAKQTYGYSYTRDNGGASGNRAVKLTPSHDTPIKTFQIWGGWTAGRLIGVKVFKNNSNTLGELVAATGLIASPKTGTYDMTFDLTDPITLIGGQAYWIICWWDGQTGLAACGAASTSGIWITLAQDDQQLGGYTYNGEPVTGTGVSTGGSPLAVVLIGP